MAPVQRLPMKVGLLQTEPVFGDRDGNLERIATAVSSAEPADLWVLPELATTGYYFLSKREALDAAEPFPSGPSCEILVEMASKEACHIVCGVAERHGDEVYNSAVLVGPTGHLATYRKTHLFGTERDCFAPGDTGFPVKTLPDGTRLGLMICFDWYFPEAMRTLALAGADVVAHPSNLVLPDCQNSMPVRCRENRVYAVTTNRIGADSREGRTLAFTGRSVLTGPDGAYLAELPVADEAAVVVDLDPTRARDKTLETGNDVFGDRRPELYGLS